MDKNLLDNKLEIAKDFLETVEALKTAQINLDNLRASEKDFLEIREKLAVKKVEDMLISCESIFTEINSYMFLAKQFKTDLESFSENIYNLSDELRLYSLEFCNVISEQDAFFEQKMINFENLKTEIKHKTDILNGEKLELKVKQKVLTEETIAMKDKRAAFERAYVEAKKDVNIKAEEIIKE